MENTKDKSNIIVRVWKFFSLYEKLWLACLIIAGVTLAILIPDEEASGTLLMSCSLIALVAGITCELLISKQCRWNFIVSVIFVEVTEIIICFVLHYYASAIVTIVFWIPIDIISFIDWTRHKDNLDAHLTAVSKLNVKDTIATVLGIAAFSVLAGYLLTLVGGEDTYLDALTAGVGISNGVLILLRFREQWIAWYIYTILEAVLWILSGQYIMLVLSLGYLTNTTYGYIKWTRYIQSSNKLYKPKKIKPICVCFFYFKYVTKHILYDNIAIYRRIKLW